MSAVAEQIKRLEAYRTRHGVLPARWFIGKIEFDDIVEELRDRFIIDPDCRRAMSRPPKLMGVQLVVRPNFT